MPYVDMLDEFVPTKAESIPPPPTTSGPGRPEDSASPTNASDEEAEQFAKQLQDQMASLMGEMDESPETRKQIESMMAELASAAATTEPNATGQPTRSGGGINAPKSKYTAAAGTTPNAEENFQETIRKTMERMQVSGEQASTAAAASTEEDPDDILAQMLKEMSKAGGSGDPSSSSGGGGGEEDFSKMLLGMMEQLTNKDILYEPMKELQTKFPGWMDKNANKTAADDLKRYKEQQGLVEEIVGRFERKGYSDDDAADREFVVERMQKVRIT